MLYSYKFRLNPNKEQEILLNKHFGCTRFVYNHFLRQRINKYKDKETQNYYDNALELPQLKQEFTWLKEVGSQALQYSIKCLQQAYENFFNKCKKKTKGKKGFPRFKSKNAKQSFKALQNVKIINNKLIIPRFKEGINIIQHREIEGNIRFATISKNKAGQYYVSITVEKEIQQLTPNNNIIGLDLNIKQIVDNHNQKIDNPLPETLRKTYLKYLAKEVSRKKKGSKARTKAKLRYNKWKLYCRNIREDFLHKVSTNIINENQVIIVEDLNVKEMFANKEPEKRKETRWKERKLHRQLQDCGFFSFVQKLIYKALWYGRELIKVNQYFPSSKLCSNCGWKNKDLKEEREWTCWECFTNHDRDRNAAVNICKEGLRTLGTRGIAYCPSVRLGIASN